MKKGLEPSAKWQGTMSIEYNIDVVLYAKLVFGQGHAGYSMPAVRYIYWIREV
jgi:hypothetical protein